MALLRRDQRGLTRTRFDISRDEWDDHYGRVYYSQKATKNQAGAALSSLLDNGMHAPVLDVDRSVVRHVNGERTSVLVTRWFAPSGERQYAWLDAMVRRGVLSGWDMRRDMLGLRRRLQVTFPYVVHAVPSRTRTHMHLLCQTQMSWDDASYLAKGLGLVGFADVDHATISGQGDFLFVWQPDTQFDTL